MRKPALFPIELVIHFHWDKTNNIRKVFNASIKFQKQHNNPLGNRRFKPTIKIEEQMLLFQVYNKYTIMASVTWFWCLYCYLWTYIVDEPFNCLTFKSCYKVSIKKGVYLKGAY